MLKALLKRSLSGGRWSRLAAFAATMLLIATSQAHAQAACSPSEMVAYSSVYYEDFGSIDGRSTDSNVLNHSFSSNGSIFDDFYAVGRSSNLAGAWMRTAGDVDADGLTTGRYLAINMRGKNEPTRSWEGEFYRQNGISIVPSGLPAGATVGGFRFSTALSGTSVGAPDVPNFTLIVEDGSTNTELDRATSSAVGVVNDGLWRTATLTVAPVSSSVTSANIVLYNSQPEGDDGNDVGVDNIALLPLVCVPPALDFTKSAVLINNIVGDANKTDVGDAIRYTFSITNNSTTTAYNVSLTETTFTGTGTAPAPFVVSGGADLDGGAGTNTDIAPGQTLVFQADYTITQDDFYAEKVDNQARADFEDLTGTTFSILSDGNAGVSGQQATSVPLPKLIVAANDTPAAVNGASGGDSSVTVLQGDTLNGVAATLASVAITAPVAGDYTDAVSGDPVTGLSLNPADGVVTVAAGTPAGTYEVAYEICEQLNALNCSEAVMTVVVDAAPIASVDDTPAAVNGA
ncbi:DUF7507 domain-containing protein, partial [Phaeobacter marinintestinus]|uniref:DUF7507 domain-containing protein n=1 Tax=Falsiphaeobacter marinintestinus TaxID=1492905 RepID=UPI001C989E60